MTEAVRVYDHKSPTTFAACGMSEEEWDKTVVPTAHRTADDLFDLTEVDSKSEAIQIFLDVLGLEHTTENIGKALGLSAAWFTRR